ncbi:MAG: TIGR00341 family protein, partial [Gammaproteobacteria bacterium]|nr:TIGR00341 family protein [Gammaproteobacteria bacterium]
PLLGPNLAFGLGTALGDLALMRKSALTTVVGIGFAVVLSVAVGLLWPMEIYSPEILSRTEVGLDSVALALASGAAAALSMTTGLSSVLVGVMVAVALLPPAVTLGLMLGRADFDLAFGAGLLLVINLVCVNLACKLVFLIRDIRPRTWVEKTKARRAMLIYIMVWALTLMVLILFIFSRRALVA